MEINCFKFYQEEEIERELADVTFEELQKARSDGSHSVYKKPNEEKKPKRANKNRYFLYLGCSVGCACASSVLQMLTQVTF